MSDDWVSLEQEVRDRIAEAREVARIHALARQARARKPQTHAAGVVRAIARVINRCRELGGPRAAAAKRI